MERYGADATHILTSDDGEDPTLRNDLTSIFIDCKDWVVAQIRAEKQLRELTSQDIKEHDEHHPEAIWVVVDKDVYDVTRRSSPHVLH